MKKITIILVMILCSSLFAFAEGQKETEEAGKEPIKIGCLDSMSGIFGVFGKGNVSGVKLAIKEINDAGGILGRHVDLIIEDTEASTEVAARKARKLILQDEVDLIIGAASTSTTAVIMNVTDQHDTLHINAEFDSHTTLAAKHDHNFQITQINNEGERGRMIGLGQQYDAEEIKRWFIFYPDYAYGHDMRDIYVEEINKYLPEAEIVGMATHPLGEPDFSNHITKILDADPQVVVSLQWAGDLANFVKQANTYGFFDKIPIFTISGANTSAVVSLKDAFPDIWMLTEQSNPYFDHMEEWRNNYHDYIGEWPTTECACVYYDAVYMFKKAVEEAGTTDSDAVAQAMEGMEWNGASGKRTLREDHLATVEYCPMVKLGSSSEYDWKVPVDSVNVPYEEVRLSNEDLIRHGCEWCETKY
jgi:branched-chain amino acid transport system substrate-binding protein